METPVNALVGPTIACILEKQFTDLKTGDRFYYENGPSATAFTQEQLNEIRKSSISGLICNNLKPRDIQPNGFLMPGASLRNQRTSCQRILRMDLNKWRV